MKKITVNQFWEWFQTKSEYLMDIDNFPQKEKDELLAEFDSVLATYSEGISYELGELTTNGRKIIFSAEGDEEYFEDVIELCTNIPILDFWDIIALASAG